MPPSKYVLKNVTKYDINIGDLRYRIPAGRARDLLAKNARLSWDDISKSLKNGSLSKRIGKGLIEVSEVVEAKLPLKQIMKTQTGPVIFPQRTKSYIVIDVGSIDEDLVRAEEEEFLKELEESNLELEQDLPIIAKEDVEKEK